MLSIQERVIAICESHATEYDNDRGGVDIYVPHIGIHFEYPNAQYPNGLWWLEVNNLYLEADTFEDLITKAEKGEWSK